MQKSLLRRRHRRIQVLRTGTLELVPRRIKCITRDFSVGGARLLLLDGRVLSGAKGVLELPGLGSVAFEVVWKYGSEIGVRFCDRPSFGPSNLREPQEIVEILEFVEEQSPEAG
jgi:hypothetical protein